MPKFSKVFYNKMPKISTSAALHNPDGIMLMYADSGHRRSLWHCGSRAIMAPGGGGGINQRSELAVVEQATASGTTDC